jgi:hypothetical protein
MNATFQKLLGDPAGILSFDLSRHGNTPANQWVRPAEYIGEYRAILSNRPLLACHYYYSPGS